MAEVEAVTPAVAVATGTVLDKYSVDTVTLSGELQKDSAAR
jgi:hypothetical protein